MANIEKRTNAKGAASYRVRVKLMGQTATATFPRKKDAHAWITKTEAAIRDGRYAPEAAGRRRTLRDLLAVYSPPSEPGARDYASNRRRYLDWWAERLGADRRLADIRPSEIVEHRDAKAAEASPSTANRYHAALRHALEVARREHEWLSENPARRVRPLREPQGRVRWLEPTEIRRLLAAVQNSPNPALYPIVLLALTTGARRGEILSLGWPDFDLKRERVTFHKTKNGERRSARLTPEATQALEAYGRVRRIDTALVFPGRTEPPRPMAIRAVWVEALARAEITDFRFHDLRHTAASYLAMNGASTLEIAAVLGHKTLAMVKRYSHLADSHVDAAVDRAAKAMFRRD